MTKKEIKQALKNHGVKGYSRALITGSWVTVGIYTGKIENSTIYLKPTNLNDKTSQRYVISL
jgi:hypothetical protein